MIETTPVPRLRLGLVLWLAGILGVVAVTAVVLPQLAAQGSLPAPLWLISIASLVQSAVFLGLAVWAGVALVPRVGLRAPVFEAAVTCRPVAVPLRRQLLPGFLAGLVGGVLLFAVDNHAPAALAKVQRQFVVPLAARVLYGGITEELLLRWGLMTVLVWLAWRVLPPRAGEVRAGVVWLAIAVSALVFGAGHLPAASAVLGALDANVVVFIVGANAVFGLLFGYLFWRHGLESAMIAHAAAHVVSHLANL
jgi:membrane protease YdiL (CAAX protease family)